MPFEESGVRDIAIPDWLQECINTQQHTSETPDSSLENTGLIAQAFEFAYKLHKGQYRASGEPYMAHPLAVAGLLRDFGGSGAMIAAGFLHDVVEDTDVTPEEIEERFGSEVRQLVEGITKISRFNFSNKTERQAEKFRRMCLALSQDIRVIVVKLADRLHNMRALEYLSDEKRCRIAKETREIYVPLANRLGLGRFKWELEDLAFKYLEPEAYRQMQKLVAEKRVDREARLSKVIAILQDRLEQAAIQCIDISGRLKHLYGIYQKMKRRQKEFHEIYDLATVRIIVQANEECYRVLAVVHDAFQPIPEQFKDYINLPKPNHYQSLHTTVIGLTGHPIKVQIRTQEMHQVAEYGIAAEWKYEETGSSSNTAITAEDEKFNQLRQWLNRKSDLKDAQEDLESIKYNLFDEDIYVFTPNGDVVCLSRGATPVDFAYRLHTDLGNHCAGVRVNGQWTVLDTPLKNGDIVEIIAEKNSHPSLDWLNFVVTTNARNRIRQWYKQSQRKGNIDRGR
jgi:GTP pyrophosphokinase